MTAVEAAGPDHERISGKVHGEVDPADPKNAVITDIDLAPRNARGKVEYIATFSLVEPKDMTRASGVLLYTVVNRGGSSTDAAPNAAGHVTLVNGWQGDVAPTSTNHTIQVPDCEKSRRIEHHRPAAAALSSIYRAIRRR